MGNAPSAPPLEALLSGLCPMRRAGKGAPAPEAPEASPAAWVRAACAPARASCGRARSRAATQEAEREAMQALVASLRAELDALSQARSPTTQTCSPQPGPALTLRAARVPQEHEGLKSAFSAKQSELEKLEKHVESAMLLVRSAAAPTAPIAALRVGTNTRSLRRGGGLRVACAAALTRLACCSGGAERAAPPLRDSSQRR